MPFEHKQIVLAESVKIDLGARTQHTAGVVWKQASYLGWDAMEWVEGDVCVRVVPELGGRVMNYQLGEHSFLWVNPLLAGSAPPPTRLAPDGGWLNWGGDKIWIAPQGWESETQWPGPPDPVIDGGPYSLEWVDEQGGSGIRLTSGPGAASGMQLSRALRMEQGSSRLRVVATMKNLGDRPRRWGLWSVTQIDASASSGQGWNRNLRAYVPAHPESSYRVLYGRDDNPQFGTGGQFVTMHYQRLVGKIGIDSPGAWIAIVDGESGVVFVQAMRYEKDSEYPDGATVEIWTNGIGTLTAYGRTEEMPEAVTENPYLIESELLGPLTTVAPGESASLTYDWFAATIGLSGEGVDRIIDCSSVGCVVRPFTVSGAGEMSGHFGCFYEGYAALEFFSEDGQLIEPPWPLGSVSMMFPLQLSGDLVAPPGSASVTLAIYKESTPSNRLGALTTLLLTS